MIQLLKDYYDKKGHRYKVMSFSGGQYVCESYETGKYAVFNANELFSAPPVKKQTTSFIEALNNSRPVEVPKVVKKTDDFIFNDTDAKDVIREELEAVKAKIAQRKKEKAAEQIPEVITPTTTVEDIPQVEHEKPKEIKPKEVEPEIKDNNKETADDFYADF